MKVGTLLAIYIVTLTDNFEKKMTTFNTTYTALSDFRALQIKDNKEAYVYAFITTIETMAGTIRQAKVGMTVSPWQMRCYKRPVSDSVAFLAIRIDCPTFALLANNGATVKALASYVKTAYETPCHNAMVNSGFCKDSENFRKDNFTMADIKTLLETTIKGLK